MFPGGEPGQIPLEGVLCRVCRKHIPAPSGDFRYADMWIISHDFIARSARIKSDFCPDSMKGFGFQHISEKKSRCVTSLYDIRRVYSEIRTGKYGGRSHSYKKIPSYFGVRRPYLKNMADGRRKILIITDSGEGRSPACPISHTGRLFTNVRLLSAGLQRVPRKDVSH